MNAPAAHALQLTTDGCEITGTPPVRFRWDDLDRVSAVQRPAAHDDVVSLRMRLRNGNTVEISEETSGFTQLVELLPDVLSGFPERSEWFYDVGESDPSDEALLYEASDSPPAD